ncbi:hypothetical protein ABPG75_001904 [Micractinium tetrahymenae]
MWHDAATTSPTNWAALATLRNSLTPPGALSSLSGLMACQFRVLEAAVACRSCAGGPVLLASCRPAANRSRARGGCRAGGNGPYQPLVGVPPPGGGGLGGAPPLQAPGALQPGVAGPSWFTVMILIGASVTTLAGGFVVFVLYLRPVLKAAERAAVAAEEAAKQMEVAAQEMEKAARVMQEDMPLTFQDMQRTSKEFEILGKQLNYLTGVVVKPVKEPVQWVGRAAETTSSTVQNVTTSSIRRVVDDIKTLANSLTPTITQVRNQLASLYPSGSGSSEEADSSAAQLEAAVPAGAGANGSSAALSSAASVAAQAEAAAREVNVSRRQADAQRWIANWRSRSRGNLKAVAAALAADQATAQQQQQQQQTVVGLDRLAQMGQMLTNGVLAAEDAAATAAVFAALERAQRAAEEAASASGALEAAIKKAEDRGALRSLDSLDEDDYEEEGPAGLPHNGS